MEDSTAQAFSFLKLYYQLSGPKNISVVVNGSPKTTSEREQLMQILKVAQIVKASRKPRPGYPNLFINFEDETNTFDHKTHTMNIYIKDYTINKVRIICMLLASIIILIIVRERLKRQEVKSNSFSLD